MKLFVTLFFISSAIIFCCRAEKWHTIPQIDGSFRLLSDSQIKEQMENDPERFAYDPFKDILYFLYTPQNPETPQQLEVGNGDLLRKSNFDPKRPTRVVVHGWTGDIKSKDIQWIRKEYVKDNYNVIGVDWGKGAQNPIYSTSRYRVRGTGEAVAQFVEFLIKEGGAKLDDILPIGHSLGGHVVGYVGRFLQETVGILPAVVSLDPAGPLFFYDSPDGRIRATDARHVEIVHTATLNLGFTQPIGTADYYPNGGRLQPGCGWDLSGNCDHSYAVAFFAESIHSPKGFWGLECSDFGSVTGSLCDFKNEWKLFGGEPLQTTKEPKIYWMQTLGESPYALGKDWYDPKAKTVWT